VRDRPNFSSLQVCDQVAANQVCDEVIDQVCDLDSVMAFGFYRTDFVDDIRCCCLQTIHSCSPCSLSRWTSTSVRVSWPSYWRAARTSYYGINCTSTPRCGYRTTTRGIFSATVTSLIPGTYYNFTVASVNKRGHIISRRYCTGITSLYHSYQ